MNIESNDLLNPILAKKIIIATISVLSLLFVIHPLIDGTVAGTNTYQLDDETKNSHSYYGNGCSSSQYPAGEDGSTKACTTRIIIDGNNQDQKNGTYYNFQAATSGTGGAITTDNTNTTDTFCPLGWQLPYSGTDGDYYDKSKSWNLLFDTYIIKNDTSGSASLKSYPLSYIYAGYYAWNTGRLYNQTNGGNYWSATSFNSTISYDLASWSTAVYPSRTALKVTGYALRCVTRK